MSTAKGTRWQRPNCIDAFLYAYNFAHKLKLEIFDEPMRREAVSGAQATEPERTQAIQPTLPTI